MTQAMTWDDVLARTDLIGGELETREDGMVFRGPIATIEKKGQSIYFTSPWGAHLNPETMKWEKNPTNSVVFVAEEVEPTDIGGGRILFQMPFFGVATIFPNDMKLSALSAANVNGLDKESTRLLALYPNLVFDREKAIQALCDRNMHSVYMDPVKALPAGTTVSDCLKTFKYDSSAEEFLWAYIELMTGEKDVHKKVY